MNVAYAFEIFELDSSVKAVEYYEFCGSSIFESFFFLPEDPSKFSRSEEPRLQFLPSLKYHFISDIECAAFLSLNMKLRLSIHY